jgi:enoyl-CoA hydratase/carnithine racemase
MSIEVRLDRRGVATVTIANATKLNTLNSTLMAEFVDAIDALRENEELRAVVLRGEGERAFIGGADITEMAGLDAGRAREFITLVHRSCDCLRRLPIPVIARIAGWTLGAGLEVAAACDMRVASTEARFGMPEVRIGIPSVVEAALLPRLIGWGRTRQLLLTGNTIDATAAKHWGLVEEISNPADLDDAVERMVAGILDSGPRAIRLQKALIQDWEDLTTDVAVQNGIDCFASAWETDEPRRMMQAFLDAQKARKGRG